MIIKTKSYSNIMLQLLLPALIVGCGEGPAVKVAANKNNKTTESANSLTSGSNSSQKVLKSHELSSESFLGVYVQKLSESNFIQVSFSKDQLVVTGKCGVNNINSSVKITFSDKVSIAAGSFGFETSVSVDESLAITNDEKSGVCLILNKVLAGDSLNLLVGYDYQTGLKTLWIETPYESMARFESLEN